MEYHHLDQQRPRSAPPPHLYAFLGRKSAKKRVGTDRWKIAGEGSWRWAAGGARSMFIQTENTPNPDSLKFVPDGNIHHMAPPPSPAFIVCSYRVCVVRCV